MTTHGGKRQGAGRRKGGRNKFTSIAREGIERAAHALGGHKRLAKWAKEDPVNERAFWATIYPKLLPLQVAGADGGPLVIEIERVIVDPPSRSATDRSGI
jgi:hypothetical protein